MADEPCFYEIVLTAAQYDYTLKALKGATFNTATETTRRNAIEQFELARPTELPPGGLDFGELEAEAERQGCTVADVLFDRARAKEPG